MRAASPSAPSPGWARPAREVAILLACVAAIGGVLAGLSVLRNELRYEPSGEADVVLRAPGQAPTVYYKQAASYCGRKGVGEVAKAYDATSTPADAAKAFADFAYRAEYKAAGSAGVKIKKIMFEGCLAGFRRRSAG
jgi:hypothetical protein